MFARNNINYGISNSREKIVTGLALKKKNAQTNRKPKIKSIDTKPKNVLIKNGYPN